MFYGLRVGRIELPALKSGDWVRDGFVCTCLKYVSDSFFINKLYFFPYYILLFILCISSLLYLF